MRKSVFVAALRWILALPGGLLASILATFPAHWLLMLLYYLKSLPSNDAFTTRDGRPVPFFGIPFETMERVVMAPLVPIVFILVGTWIVPARKWTAAVMLGVLWFLLITIAITWVVSTDRIVIEFTFTTFLVLGLNVAGVIYALRTSFLKHGVKPHQAAGAE
jgi:hypothetical protein